MLALALIVPPWLLSVWNLSRRETIYSNIWLLFLRIESDIVFFISIFSLLVVEREFSLFLIVRVKGKIEIWMDSKCFVKVLSKKLDLHVYISFLYLQALNLNVPTLRANSWFLIVFCICHKKIFLCMILKWYGCYNAGHEVILCFLNLQTFSAF